MIITTQLQQQQQDKYMKNKFPKLQNRIVFYSHYVVSFLLTEQFIQI